MPDLAAVAVHRLRSLLTQTPDLLIFTNKP